jgi:hypothetical protein
MSDTQKKAEELIDNLSDTLRILSELRIYELTGEFTAEQIKNAQTRTMMMNALTENIRNCVVAAKRVRSLYE